ncbi:MFS transporter [Agromyces sp. G08B096]|uniref:MFS transporter n=1 Tax=Agromyces sp. G08B096 TaxID=3156399 RepID=A0AAU7W778_9MICO
MASYLDSGIIVSVGVSLAIWGEHFDMSVWMLGSISAILTASIAIGSLVGGRLADLFGRKLVYGVDIAVYAVGTLLIVFAPDATVLLIGVLIAGLAAGADLPTSLAVVSDSVPVWARGRLIGFTQVMWTIGIAVVTVLGIVTSTLGYFGTQLIVGHLAIAAIVTWALRSRLKLEDHRDDASGLEADRADLESDRPELERAPLADLLRPATLWPLLTTFAYYVFWGIAANTFGQFGTYFLVTVSGASQTVATVMNFAFLPLAIVLGLVFVRFADTVWRDRLFVAAAILQILAFAVGAVSAGSSLVAMVVFFALYNIAYNFAGEANYKVWSQLLFRQDVRGTAQGVSYAVARGVFALVALFTPALLAWSPEVLLWGLVACLVVSTLMGIVITRRQIPAHERTAPRPALEGERR